MESRAEEFEGVEHQILIPAALLEFEIRALFADHAHAYIREQFRLADQKATFFFGASCATLYVLFLRVHTVQPWLKSLLSWNLADVLALLALITLATACVLGVMVVTPRLEGWSKGLIFWESIATRKTSEQYIRAALTLSHKHLVAETLRNCYELAFICRRKYRLLAWQFRIMLFGLTLAAPYLLLASG